MVEGIRPPYGKPLGPLLTDDDLIDSFLTNARAGHSDTYHIEDRVLLLSRFTPVALRLGSGAVLVRTDLDMAPITAAMLAKMWRLLASDPPLATPAAVQAIGYPAVWELWGTDSDEAKWLLEEAAVAWS